MLVNDRKEIRNVGISPQFQPLRVQIKSSVMAAAVSVSSNLSISGREEAQFNSSSDTVDRHYPSTQGGLKPCMCT